MSYKIIVIDFFERQAKRLLKKYPSLSNELKGLKSTLELSPSTGTPIGNDCYKIRIAIASKNRGKSGGARIITHVKVVGETVFLLSIYDKGEQSNISEQELQALLQGLAETK